MECGSDSIRWTQTRKLLLGTLNIFKVAVINNPWIFSKGFGAHNIAFNHKKITNRVILPICTDYKFSTFVNKTTVDISAVNDNRRLIGFIFRGINHTNINSCILLQPESIKNGRRRFSRNKWTVAQSDQLKIFRKITSVSKYTFFLYEILKTYKSIRQIRCNN